KDLAKRAIHKIAALSGKPVEEKEPEAAVPVEPLPQRVSGGMVSPIVDAMAHEAELAAKSPMQPEREPDEEDEPHDPDEPAKPEPAPPQPMPTAWSQPHTQSEEPLGMLDLEEPP